MSTLTYEGTLVVRTCWCGIRHAIPEELSRALDRNESTNAYCPMGHSYVSATHRKKREDELREQLDAERRRTQATRELLAAEERSHAATRGHLTRTKRRVQAGTCPCCQRTFQQLARHMKAKHPDYAEPRGDA